jgi:hypothetical protein
MRWRVAVFGTLGALATMLAAAVLLAPEVVLAVGPVDALVTALSGTDPTTVMLVATGIVGLYVAVAARTGGRTPVPESSAETRFDDAVTNPPEAVTADQRTLTAADLDADVAVAIERGGEPLRAVRTLLADLAADAYADRERVTPEEARQAVETGAWTGDRLAAVFLAGPSGPAVSWSGRIRLWLTPERERERRIERTLAAIDAVQEAGA